MFRIYAKLSKHKSKIINNPRTEWAKDMKRHFTKEEISIDGKWAH
jgi:hypothetical protein